MSVPELKISDNVQDVSGPCFIMVHWVCVGSDLGLFIIMCRINEL